MCSTCIQEKMLWLEYCYKSRDLSSKTRKIPVDGKHCCKYIVVKIFNVVRHGIRYIQPNKIVIKRMCINNHNFPTMKFLLHLKYFFIIIVLSSELSLPYSHINSLLPWGVPCNSNLLTSCFKNLC